MVIKLGADLGQLLISQLFFAYLSLRLAIESNPLMITLLVLIQLVLTKLASKVIYVKKLFFRQFQRDPSSG